MFNTMRDLLLWSAKEGLKLATEKGVEIALEDPGSLAHKYIIDDIEYLETKVLLYEQNDLRRDFI